MGDRLAIVHDKARIRLRDLRGEKERIDVKYLPRMTINQRSLLFRPERSFTCCPHQVQLLQCLYGVGLAQTVRQNRGKSAQQQIESNMKVQKSFFSEAKLERRTYYSTNVLAASHCSVLSMPLVAALQRLTCPLKMAVDTDKQAS